MKIYMKGVLVKACYAVAILLSIASIALPILN